MFIGPAPHILRPSLLSVLRPQDVFQTLLQPANTMQPAINALPFSPGLLIDKDRVAATDWSWRSAARNNFANTLASNATAAEAAWAGYSGTNNRVVYALKQQSKVYAEVTYTGDGVASRQIAHGLGIKPGLMLIRNRGTGSWGVKHLSLSLGQRLTLNTTAAAGADSSDFFSIEPTDTSFAVGGYNTSGATYVVYLFAHDPDTANGIIRCGSGNVTLPWTPQWVFFKDAGATGNWFVEDATRGLGASSSPALNPNLTAIEAASTALGVSGNTLTFSGLTTPVWCAIRAPI